MGIIKITDKISGLWKWYRGLDFSGSFDQAFPLVKSRESSLNVRIFISVYTGLMFVDSARKEVLSEYIRVWYSSRNMTVKIYFYSHYEVIFYWLLTSFCLTQIPLLCFLKSQIMLLEAANFLVDASVILCYFSSCRYDSWMSWRTTE